MSKWCEKECLALDGMKGLITDHDDDDCCLFPEVSGDRRLIRFLRGNELNHEKAADAYNEFLKWRKKYNVNQIRNEILYEGRNHPSKFPKGDIILKLMPQIIIAPHVSDKLGRPIALENFDFDPNSFLDIISLDDWRTFYMYSIEFRILIMEQLAERNDREYLLKYPLIRTRTDGWGSVLQLCFLRDLKGVGLKHFGAKSKSIFNVTLDTALKNYPEYLGKSYLLNVPWVFTGVWNTMKGAFDENLIKKFALLGSNYLPALLEDLPYESIPSSLGGGLRNECYNFDFDTRPGGFYERKVIPKSVFIDSIPLAHVPVEPVPIKVPTPRNISLQKEDSNIITSPGTLIRYDDEESIIDMISPTSATTETLTGEIATSLHSISPEYGYTRNNVSPLTSSQGSPEINSPTSHTSHTSNRRRSSNLRRHSWNSVNSSNPTRRRHRRSTANSDRFSVILKNYNDKLSPTMQIEDASVYLSTIDEKSAQSSLTTPYFQKLPSFLTKPFTKKKDKLYTQVMDDIDIIHYTQYDRNDPLYVDTDLYEDNMSYEVDMTLTDDSNSNIPLEKRFFRRTFSNFLTSTNATSGNKDKSLKSSNSPKTSSTSPSRYTMLSSFKPPSLNQLFSPNFLSNSTHSTTSSKKNISWKYIGNSGMSPNSNPIYTKDLYHIQTEDTSDSSSIYHSDTKLMSLSSDNLVKLQSSKSFHTSIRNLPQSNGTCISSQKNHNGELIDTNAPMDYRDSILNDPTLLLQYKERYGIHSPTASATNTTYHSHKQLLPMSATSSNATSHSSAAIHRDIILKKQHIHHKAFKSNRNLIGRIFASKQATTTTATTTTAPLSSHHTTNSLPMSSKYTSIHENGENYPHHILQQTIKPENYTENYYHSDVHHTPLYISTNSANNNIDSNQATLEIQTMNLSGKKMKEIRDSVISTITVSDTSLYSSNIKQHNITTNTSSSSTSHSISKTVSMNQILVKKGKSRYGDNSRMNHINETIISDVMNDNNETAAARERSEQYDRIKKRLDGAKRHIHVSEDNNTHGNTGNGNSSQLNQPQNSTLYQTRTDESDCTNIHESSHIYVMNRYGRIRDSMDGRPVSQHNLNTHEHTNRYKSHSQNNNNNQMIGEEEDDDAYDDIYSQRIRTSYRARQQLGGSPLLTTKEYMESNAERTSLYSSETTPDILRNTQNSSMNTFTMTTPSKLKSMKNNTYYMKIKTTCQHLFSLRHHPLFKTLVLCLLMLLLTYYGYNLLVLSILIPIIAYIIYSLSYLTPASNTLSSSAHSTVHTATSPHDSAHICCICQSPNSRISSPTSTSTTMEIPNKKNHNND